MRNKTVSNSKGLAGWLDDFIVGLSKKEASNVDIDTNEEEVVGNMEEENIETTATININDLEKIVWNDETFRVHFDENGANVINEFGNSVTFLKDLKTIEEVDHALNSKQVVTSSDELTEEKEVVAVEEMEDDFENALTAAVESIPTEEDKEEIIANKEEITEDVLANDDQVVVDPEADGGNVFEAIIAGFEEIEKRLATVEQLYARDPQITQDEMAVQVLEEETKRFTETADETTKQISEEQSHDLTTPAGRVEISNAEQSSEVEQLVTEEVTVEDQKDETEQVEDTNDTTEQVKDTTDTTENVEENMEKLTGKDEKIFQNGICPETGEELVKAKTAGSFLGIYSPKGGTEYAVNLNTGDIFKYKG